MKFNFDTETNRKNTSSVKWGLMMDEEDPLIMKPTDAFFGKDRILPMWIADMDFPTAQPIIDALAARVQHGIFGYSLPTDSYRQTIVDWMHRRHNWQIDPAWIVNTPGVVPALNLLVRTFVAPGEKVIIQPPVYYPFHAAIENNGAEVVPNPLRYEKGRYQMDFADLEAKARDPQVTMAILCHPHNPVGRVWTPDELTRFAEICVTNNIQIISDEIFGDLVYEGVAFHPMASLRDDLSQHVITCTAASKTFNMAGLRLSNIIVADDEQRKRFAQAILSVGIIPVGAFAVVAVEAAYKHGEEWLTQVTEYIEGNLRYLEDFLATHIPQISLVPPDGTYMVWLDCRALGLDNDSLHHLMLHEARVYLEEGHIFGPEGEGFQRMNIACPRHILVEVLERIRDAVADL